MPLANPGEVFPKPISPKAPIPGLLKGQNAIVTGANSGIGEGVAYALAQAGANVCVNYVVGEESAQKVVKQVESYGVKGLAIQADVSKEDEVQKMFAEVTQEFGWLDILVNNAGLQRDSAFADMSLKDWNTVINVNLTGQFLCAREAVRHFLKKGVKENISCAAGKVICMSSVHQKIAWAGHANYAASKGGIHMLMESMSQELAPYRIRVNAICPGAIRTPINTEAWETPEAYNSLMNLVPYNRIGEPVDIAQAAVWLASDYSDYISGVSLFVDGGMCLYPGFRAGG